MAGRSQHFIPQSLLRGFGVRKGRTTRLVAFTRERGVFPTATTGIAAEREFYSALSIDGGEPTLDERITAIEGGLGELLLFLRGLPDGEAVDGRVAGALVGHLIVRNDHVRKTLAYSSTTMLCDLTSSFADPVAARRMMGVDGDVDGVLPELIRSLVRSRRRTPGQDQLDAAETEIFEDMLRHARTAFDGAHAEVAANLVAELPSLLLSMPEAVAAAQRDVLGVDLAPSSKVEDLARLRWRVVDAAGPTPLPDCLGVALGGREGDCPLTLADLSGAVTVCMPLATTRLLMGSSDGRSTQPPKLNELLVSCSWDFYVGRDRSSGFDELRPFIATRARAVLDEAMADAGRGP